MTPAPLPPASVQPVALTAAGVRRGVRQSLPVLVSLVPFGLVCGITAQGHGLSLQAAMLMSALVFAGSSQLVALSHWDAAGSAPVLAATLSTLVVNLRFALMGPVLAPWLDRLRGWRLWGTLALLVDQSWALAVADMGAGGRDAGVLLGASVAMWGTWVLSTGLGHVLGAAMRPPEGHPLFFAALAVFVAMLCTMWRGRGDALPWAVAAVAATATARLLPGTSWHIVAGALAGSLAGLLRDRVRPRRARGTA